MPRKLLLPLALLLAVRSLAQGQEAQFNASIRAREEIWGWFDDTDAGSYAFTGILARGGVSKQKDKFGFNVELAVPLLLGLPDDAVLPPPRGQLGLGPTYWVTNDSSSSAIGLFLKQAYIRYGAKPNSDGYAARLGRFEFIEGTETTPTNAMLAALKRDRIAHRLIGNFGFSHVQRSFDGVLLTAHRKVNVTLAAMRPTQGVFDVNGWPDLDVGVGYLAVTNRPAKTESYDARAFVIYYRDYRANALPTVTITTFGAHVLKAGKIGSAGANLLLWGVLQTGRWGNEDQGAQAFAVEAGVSPKASWQPTARLGLDWASGDDQSGDGKRGTFFQILPTPRIYARFPFFNMMNTTDAFLSIGASPSGSTGVRVDVHRLWLTEEADLWYSGGGAFEDETFGFAGRPSNGSDDLSTLIDASVNVKITRTFSANAYLGWARDGAVIDRIYPAANAGMFGHIELEWRK